MKEIVTPAVLYRIYQYSDRSAIAMAFTPEYGKIKLFIKNAYSKKGAPMRFIPGNLTFGMKETSDLNRFGGFSHNPQYYSYLNQPDIMMRLHLSFDFFDNLFNFGEGCKVFWTLLLKYTDENYRQLCLYTVYRLMREAGVAFEFTCRCGNMCGEKVLYHGELFCQKCSKVPSGGILLDETIAGLLKIFVDNDNYRHKTFTPSEEVALLTLFARHLDDINGKEGLIKSLSIFTELCNN